MAIVTKLVSNQFTINDSGKVYVASGQGKLKENKILVGDKVEYKLQNGRAIITKVKERRNSLVRPSIANIDNLVIVLSSQPAPDFILVDKLILTCMYNDICPILCVNKEDMFPDFINTVKGQYGEVVNNIISVSAKVGTGLDKLKEIIKGEVSAFAGQSAVGKSTILNALLDSAVCKTGEISSKTHRGRHTTRHTEMFEIDEDTYLIDTPGFSMLNISGITYDNLKDYYPDFSLFKCKYTSCSHTREGVDECAVKSATLSGKIDKARYERYNIIYDELRDRRVIYEKN